MRVTRKQIRRILKEFSNITHEDVVAYLQAQAREYARDGALTPPGVQELLMDDFMDNIGAYADLSPEYQELIDSLAGMPGASPILEVFAATAEEEAHKVNKEAGISLVTDQAFWEERGISTGEELAKSLLSSTYSDYYKEIHGIRPHWNMERISAMTVEEIQAEIEQLDREAAEIAATDPDEWMEERHWEEQEYRDLEDTVMAAVKANPEDIPEEFLEYETAPMQQGMGRRPAGSKAQRRMESAHHLQELWGKAKWEKELEKMEARDNIETVGDLLNFLALIKNAKTDEQGMSALKDLGAGVIIDLIPGGGTISSIKDLLTTTYSMPDEKRTGTGLDYLDVDDEVAAIVDNPIENKFLEALIDKFDSIPKETRLEQINMTKQLSDYIKAEFDSRTVAGFEEGKTMRITRGQLRRIIKEGIDIVNNETGELLVFEDDWETRGGTAPEAAARNTLKRLRITPIKEEPPSGDSDVTDIWVEPSDYALLDTEFGGKRRYRRNKRERERLDIDNLQARLDQWAADAGGDYAGDNPGIDMQDVAWDLAASAEYSFEPDEWEELVWSIADGDEENLQTYIADMIVG